MFDCTHLLLSVMSCLHIFSAFAILLQTLTEEPIPDAVVHQMVLETIAEYDLPPLNGERHRLSSSCIGIQKKACVEYDHQRAEESVMSDWFGTVLHFMDKQFERTFQISDIW